MNRRNNSLARPRVSSSWLACLLAGWLVLLGLGAAVHCSHSDSPGHHSCAACLIAHGGLIADGAIGVTAFLAGTALALPRTGESSVASIFDLRLAPGRAPPA
jgi:hypothetical protein